MSYILVFFTISTLILLHEAGHLLAAKWKGIPVIRFFYWIRTAPMGIQVE